MLTQEQADKFADWAIAQENRYFAQMKKRYPIDPETAQMSDDELLKELTA